MYNARTMKRWIVYLLLGHVSASYATALAYWLLFHTRGPFGSVGGFLLVPIRVLLQLLQNSMEPLTWQYAPVQTVLCWLCYFGCFVGTIILLRIDRRQRLEPGRLVEG